MAVLADASRIRCWCGREYQQLGADGHDWDEPASAAAYRAHYAVEGPPSLAQAEEVQRQLFGITATVVIVIPTLPIVGGLFGQQ